MGRHRTIYENRAVELLPRVVELTNLHEFATRSVKHARIALAAAKCDRDFMLQGRLQLFINKAAARLEKGNIILKDQAEKAAGILAKDESVAKVEGAVRSSTEPEGATSVSLATEVFKATDPSIFARKRKVAQFITDGSRTAGQGGGTRSLVARRCQMGIYREFYKTRSITTQPVH
jgi:hypothetical protein